jgi:hypothetical protein
VQAIAQTASARAQQTPLNERSLYQRAGFSWARDAHRRAEAFALLRDAGWLKPPQPDGHGRPRGDWEVNPRVLEAKQ